MDFFLKNIADHFFLFCVITCLCFIIVALAQNNKRLHSFIAYLEQEAATETVKNIDIKATAAQLITRNNKLVAENIDLKRQLTNQVGKFNYEKGLLESRVETLELKCKGHKKSRHLKGAKR